MKEKTPTKNDKGVDLMAIRSVFIPTNKYPYFEDISVNMPWFGGFAPQQKRRCYLSQHLNFLADPRYSTYKPLEISSASHVPVGSALSAMNLKKHCNVLGHDVVLESAFQASRIYQRIDGSKIGSFPELLDLPGKECKKQVKDLSEGLHSYQYTFDGLDFPAPAFHISLFYDWLYINALCEDSNREAREALIHGGFNAFTDIATKSLNSQARSCAIFVSLEQLGLLDRVRSFEAYIELFRVDLTKHDYAGKGAWNNVQLLIKGCYKPLHLPVQQRVSAEEVKDYYDKHFAKKNKA